MDQFYAIFRNAVLETVRQPLYALVVVVACAMIALMPAFSAQIYAFGAGSGLQHSAERMIAELGLGTVLLAGLVLAVFSAASVISREIENKTALTVLSKKVPRSTFVVGKYLGVAVAVMLATMTCSITVLLTVRIGPKVAVSDPLDFGVIGGMAGAALLAVIIATMRNYFRGRPWVGSFTLSFISLMILLFCVLLFFDKNYNFVLSPHPGHGPEEISAPHGFQASYDWEVARAAVLTIQSVLLMVGVAVAASTRLNVGGNLAVCTVAFLGGLTSDYFHAEILRAFAAEAVPSLSNRLLMCGVNLWRAFLPDLQTFWMSDALTREHHIPSVYILWASGYAACYVAAMLLLAAFLFQKREVS